MIADLVRRYLARHPEEAGRLARLVDLLALGDAALTSRAHLPGHVTASGLVLDPARARMLMVEHEALGRWLQPGGHVEPGDRSPLDAAIREVAEETGYAGLTLLAQPGELPLDIDIHPVPANPRNGEPEHDHHDFRYLFVCPDPARRGRLAESARVEWRALDAVAGEPGFAALVRKVRRAAV